MKNLLTLCLLLLSFPLVQAATLTVNNTSPTVGQYSTVQAAVYAAASGDTILIQGSEINYGDVRLPNTKALTLRGSGWNPSYRPSIYKSTLGIITFDDCAHDITIEGLVFDYTNMSGDGTTACRGQSNIKIQYCMGTISLAYGHHFIIQNNYYLRVNGNPNISDALIQYNVINGLGDFRGIRRDIPGDIRYGAKNVRIDHNVFIGAGIDQLQNAIITNNIFYDCNVKSQNISQCLVSNNISYYSSDPSLAVFFAGNNTTPGNYLGNNIINADPLFVNYLTQWNPVNDYRLQANSPAKNAGTDGSDLGVFSNGNIFSRTGEVTPSVRSFQISNPVTVPNGSLNVKMTASKARDGN